MRTLFFTIAGTCLALLSACDVQQENGNDIRNEQPALLKDQPWNVTQTISGNERICTLSHGNIEITQKFQNGKIMPQVATSNRLNPGDRYKILVGRQFYETQEMIFDPIQSQAIINDLMKEPVIYTEKREYTIGQSHHWRSIDNKISMQGFASQYRACDQYVRSDSGTKKEPASLQAPSWGEGSH